jgi:hypothetical protein
MELNYLAVIVATVVQFIVSAIWYMPVFGKVWGKIHHFDALSLEAQKIAQKQMMPLLGIQVVMTGVTTSVLALLLSLFLAEWNSYTVALIVWLGFSMPAQVSAVLFGGTEPKWMIKKIAIMTGGSLLSLLVATLVLGIF